jgi:hypothetical protein
VPVELGGGDAVAPVAPPTGDAPGSRFQTGHGDRNPKRTNDVLPKPEEIIRHLPVGPLMPQDSVTNGACVKDFAARSARKMLPRREEQEVERR